MAENHNERWLPVVGWEDLYQVSDLGRVLSLPRTYAVLHWRDGSPYTRRIAGGMLRWLPSTAGYPQVCLSRSSQVSRVFVHRLVAEAFVENSNGLQIVNHLNGDKLDARSVNLEWTDHAGNFAHAIETGLKNQTPQKCTESAVRAAYALLAGTKLPTLIVFAEALGVDWATAKRYANQYGLAVSKRKSPTAREAVKR